MLMGGFESPDPETGSESGDLFPRALLLLLTHVLRTLWNVIVLAHVILF